MHILGIDIGGSGIKGAIVDTQTGDLVSDRLRIPTPKPATPESVADKVKELVGLFNYSDVVGCSFPTVVIDGQARSFGNIDESWLGTQIDKLFTSATGLPFVVYNDADVAGIAEMQLGEGKGLKGMVIMVTIGTGLGTGIFYDGRPIPNIELGRILGKDGLPIEFYAGDKARKTDGLSWKEWGKRFNYFLKHVERVFSPSHFIIGGGASKKYNRYEKQITVKTPVKIAEFKNNAGIIGAAIAAEKYLIARKKHSNE